jgi:hypothetical protein
MVTQLEVRKRTGERPITLQELGEMIGVPIVVRPWWGSVRGTCGKRRVWECPGQPTGSRKKIPEVRKGKIVVWEGRCCYKAPRDHGRRYQRHVHAQTIKVISVARRTMLIAIHLSGTDAHFLLGVDEEHPFVVRVSGRPQTVKETFDWLMPKRVKEAIARGLNVSRQGDWYFIPTDIVPKRDSITGAVYGSRPELRTNTLYRGAPLVFNGSQTRHCGDLVVYQSIRGANGPVPSVRGNIQAPNHKALYLDTWHTAVRNQSHPWRNADQQRGHFFDD